jgi:RNA polymerase sigma-B factor
MTIRRCAVMLPGPAAPEATPTPTADPTPTPTATPDPTADREPPRSPGPSHPRQWRWPVPVDDVQALLQQRVTLPDDDPRHGEIRSRVVELCLPVAHRVARWFRFDGLPQDDLVQVASMGLVQALNRYDPRLGFEFLGFAVPTMCGELRHYLRDLAWTLHVPRSVQETRVQVRRGRDELTQRLRREPTVQELAAHLDISGTEVAEADIASSARRPMSLNHRVVADEPVELVELLGDRDAEFERVEYHMDIWKHLAELPERDRELIAMRFFGELTQKEIGQRMGVSQMHVSRLLNRALAFLRRRLLEDAA